MMINEVWSNELDYMSIKNNEFSVLGLYESINYQIVVVVTLNSSKYVVINGPDAVQQPRGCFDILIISDVKDWY